MKAIQKELGEGDDQTQGDRGARARRSRRPACPRRSRRKRCASSTGCRRCRRPPPSTRSRAPISTGSSRCRGASETDEVIDLPQTQARARRRSLGPREGQGPHPRVPRRPQAEPRRARARSSASSGPPGVGKTSLGALDRASRSAASSSASRSAACATRPRSAAIGAPTSARCPARSSRGCAAPSRRTRSSSSTRSTSSARTSAAIRRRRCSRCSIRSRTTRSAITTSTCRSICRRCCSSRRPTCSTRCRRRCATAWRCSSSPATPRRRSSRSRSDHLVRQAGRRTTGCTPASTSRFTDAALAPGRSAATRARPASATSSARSARSAARWRGGAPRATRRRSRSRRDVVVELLGAPQFLDEEMEERTKDPGVAIGLAWTPVGGEVLFIEASRMAGSGSLTLTGQLGDVMKESARAALSWLRAHATRARHRSGLLQDVGDPRARAVGRDSRRTGRRPA